MSSLVIVVSAVLVPSLQQADRQTDTRTQNHRTTDAAKRLTHVIKSATVAFITLGRQNMIGPSLVLLFSIDIKQRTLNDAETIILKGKNESFGVYTRDSATTWRVGVYKTMLREVLFKYVP